MLLRSSSFYYDLCFKSKIYLPLWSRSILCEIQIQVSPFLCTDVSLTSVCYMSFYRCLGFACNGSPGPICIRWCIGQHSQWADEVWHRPVWEWRRSGPESRGEQAALSSWGKKAQLLEVKTRGGVEVWKCVRFGSWPLTLFSVTTPWAIGDWSPPASPTLVSRSVVALPSDSLSFIASLCKCQFAFIPLLFLFLCFTVCFPFALVFHLKVRPSVLRFFTSAYFAC